MKGFIMNKLTQKQVDIIEKKISVCKNKAIVLLDVAGNKAIPTSEYNSNIYCINDAGEILWQIKAKPSGFERDSFVSINYNDNRLVARNFSGFEYKVNLENGEVESIGWDK